MRVASSVIFLLGVMACSPEDGGHADHAAQDRTAPVSTEAPAGTYTLDKAHASLIFRVDHLGFSNYTARFRRFDARLQFDPSAPAGMSVTATIDPTSLETDFPDPDKLDFNAVLTGADWLAAAQFPEITFQSTSIELTGPDSAKMTGDLTLHGVTRPVTLDVTFNGGYAGHPMDPNARIGFSAHGALKRSAFGIALGIPPEGSKIGVSDEVAFTIEAEFSGPPLPQKAP